MTKESEQYQSNKGKLMELYFRIWNDVKLKIAPGFTQPGAILN
jgi:hypothetical protein